MRISGKRASVNCCCSLEIDSVDKAHFFEQTENRDSVAEFPSTGDTESIYRSFKGPHPAMFHAYPPLRHRTKAADALRKTEELVASSSQNRSVMFLSTFSRTKKDFNFKGSNSIARITDEMKLRRR